MLNALLRRFTGGGQKSSREAAKKRLQFALVYDQLEVNDSTLKLLQADIIEVISRYFEIDRESLHLQVQREKDVSALVFNTPILCVKKEPAVAAADGRGRKSYKKKKK